jgi:hypothetical protein
MLLDTALRLAGTIGLEALALIVWNVGTRSPMTVARDVRRAFAHGDGLFAGCVSLAIGAIFIAAAVVLVIPVLSPELDDFVPVEVFTFLVAIALEYLVGNDVRRLVGGGGA